MVFDRVLTDAEIGGDGLARVDRDHEVHDLMLSPGQRGDVGGRGPPQRRCFRQLVRMVQCSLDALGKELSADGFLDEIEGAGPYCLNHRGTIRGGGDRNAGKLIVFVFWSCSTASSWWGSRRKTNSTVRSINTPLPTRLD